MAANAASTSACVARPLSTTSLPITESEELPLREPPLSPLALAAGSDEELTGRAESLGSGVGFDFGSAWLTMTLVLATCEKSN